MNQYTSSSAEETHEIAKKIARDMAGTSKKLICLKGNLGAGKTTFVKGFAEEYGVNPSSVKSPTYTYFRLYETPKGSLYHADYYRLSAVDDLVENELQEIVHNASFPILIEWPEKIEHVLPQDRIEICIALGENEKDREIKVNHL